MKLIRIIKNWQWPDLLQQTPGREGIWENIRFTEEPIEQCDYFIILNNLQEELQIQCPPGNIWRIVQEPPTKFLKSWHVNPAYSTQTFTCDPELSGPEYIRSHPMVPWHVNRDYDFLSTVPVPEKSKILSWITSTRNVLPGHKKRMSFLYFIKEKLDELDLLGGNIRHILKQDAKEKIEKEQRELGFKSIEDKWAGLAPYKYSLAVESHSGPDYWTEKVADCFLARTVPIYYGCTNLEDYFPPESFIRIDIEKPEEALDIIKRIIKEDRWRERLPALEKARDLVLNTHQFFPTVSRYIHSTIPGQMPGKDKKNMKIHLKPSDPKNKLKVSVVICTYNRDQLLPGCLESLAHQQIGKDLYEVIIIDNNSSDNTREVANEFLEKNSNFRLLFEKQQGLSHARNLGLQEARADYIAYIDDDARVREDWLKQTLEIIDKKQPDIFGGPAYPLFPGGKPDWFKEEYGIRGDMGETGWLKKGFIIGTNIVFRKSLLREYGGFDPALGMTGDQLAYGEETHLVYRALEEGKKVYYSREMAVDDHLPDYKKSLAFFIYSWYRVGKDLGTIKKQAFDFKELPRLLKNIDKTFNQFDAALHKNKRNLQQFPYPENYVIENLKQNFVAIGMCVDYFLKQQNFTPERFGELAGKIARRHGLFKTIVKMLRYRFKLRKNKKAPAQQTDKKSSSIDDVLKKLKENENLILELGAGKTRRGDRWITLDTHKNCDIIHDLGKPLPFPDNTFLNIYSSHVLEHFHHNELIALLKEVYRILKPGGAFKICVPDASIYLKAYCSPQAFDADFYCRYKPAVHLYSKIDYVNYMAYMNGHHKMMFDAENLPAILNAVGFKNVRERAFDPSLDLKKRDYESLYFSAEKEKSA